MAQKTYPRPESHHAVTTVNVLARHVRETGVPISLPVPIEQIIEITYGLTLLWDDIDEPPDCQILGALYPQQRRIVMNTLHEAMFDRYIGPARFTLAHELGHWIYDADDPDQMTLGIEDGTAAEEFCYHREHDGLSEDTRIREMNANKFAAHLLLPEHLVKAVSVDAILGDFRRTAARWGVSQTTLRIRLDTLGLLDDGDRMQLLLGE